MKSKTFILSTTILALLHSPALLQAQPENEQPAPADPCSAQPKAERDTQPDTDELTEKLDRCNGVLKPPPNGDQEIEKPPPETGETPVIPPGELPDQQQKPE
jgi:hypothetical protein